MADDIKKTWLSMSERALHEHLTRQKYPPNILRGILDKVAALKKQAKGKRVHDHAVKQRWRDVLSPARIELGVIRTLKSQLRAAATEAAHKRIEVLTEYEGVIVKVVARLRNVQKTGKYTPTQLVEGLRKAGKWHTELGDGSHWTDYVSGADRIRITSLFNKLPDAKRGKNKEPFPRRIPRPEHRRLKHALWDHIVDEKLKLEQELDFPNCPNADELEATILQMEEAIFKLSELPPNAIGPRTWKELLKD